MGLKSLRRKLMREHERKMSSARGRCSAGFARLEAGTGRVRASKHYGMLGIEAVMGATYAKFTTEVAGDDDMTQMDGNSEGQPKGMRCLIRSNTIKQ